MAREKDQHAELKWDGDHAYARFGGKKHRYGSRAGTQPGTKARRDLEDKIRARFKAAYGLWMVEGCPSLVTTETPDKEKPVLMFDVMQKWGQRNLKHYDRDGKMNREGQLCAEALEPIAEMFVDLPVEDFHIEHLETCQDWFHREKDYTRNHINKQIGRIVRMFKWAAKRRLCSPEKHIILKEIDPLRRGRCGTVRDTQKVRPVSFHVIDQTCEVLPDLLADMLRVQMLAAMRPGEVCIMRVCDIERHPPSYADGCWIYRPAEYKTMHCHDEGHDERIFLGPRAQDILAPYLLRLGPEDYVFSPREVVNEMRRQRYSKRKTPLQFGNSKGTNRKSQRKVEPGKHYSANTYRLAIQKRVARANAQREADGLPLIERFHPHQLRHTQATYIREVKGSVDPVKAVLRHESLSMSDHYSNEDGKLAAETMRQLG